MPPRIVVPNPSDLDKIDPIFRSCLPVYDNLEEYSRPALVVALEYARDHEIPLADTILAVVAENIADEAPELAGDIHRGLQALAQVPTATPEQAYAAVYAGFRFVCDWLDPRAYGRPSVGQLHQMVNQLTMLARLAVIEGVVIRFDPASPQVRPIRR